MPRPCARSRFWDGTRPRPQRTMGAELLRGFADSLLVSTSNTVELANGHSHTNGVDSRRFPRETPPGPIMLDGSLPSPAPSEGGLEILDTHQKAFQVNMDQSK